VSTATVQAYDVARIRKDFPILARSVHGKPLVFLDSAASAQKPRVVIEAERRCYEEYYANVHRGVYQLSMQATDAYEGARVKVQKFLGAAASKEIVFTRGTTEAVNLVASSYGRRNLGAGDEVLITGLEHHSNIVPWQMLCEQQGARLRVVPIGDAGDVPLDALERLIGPKTRIVAVAHISNALGTLLDVREIARIAHGRGVPVFVDGAQSAPRIPVNVRELDCDFFAFSGHKTYGPSGIGALYGKAELLKAMPPYMGGGDMIASVSFEKTTYNDLPYKFEAGTPNIAGAIGLGAALDYLTSLGLERIAAHEADVLAYGSEQLSQLAGLTLVGTAKPKAGVLSFVLDGIHPHDIGTVLDYEGIALRTGHHCAQPVMDRFGIPATARASLGLYNTREEIDALLRGLAKVQELFK
jgi:cysteine desulfurase/selenocysteine lyase